MLLTFRCLLAKRIARRASSSQLRLRPQNAINSLPFCLFYFRPFAIDHRTFRCPSCSNPLPTALPACPNCSYIAALPSNTPHHDVFGLQHEQNLFVLDTFELKNRFRTAQGVCHPDAWASKGKVCPVFPHSMIFKPMQLMRGNKEKHVLAEALSSQINAAYQVLQCPLSRVEYILQKKGLAIEETDHLDDAMFISEILDAREELGDADDPKVVEGIEKVYHDKVETCIQDIEQLVGRGAWKETHTAAVKLKYLLGIQNAVKTWRDLHG